MNDIADAYEALRTLLNNPPEDLPGRWIAEWAKTGNGGAGGHVLMSRICNLLDIQDEGGVEVAAFAFLAFRLRVRGALVPSALVDVCAPLVTCATATSPADLEEFACTLAAPINVPAAATGKPEQTTVHPEVIVLSVEVAPDGFRFDEAQSEIIRTMAGRTERMVAPWHRVAETFAPIGGIASQAPARPREMRWRRRGHRPDTDPTR